MNSKRLMSYQPEKSEILSDGENKMDAVPEDNEDGTSQMNISTIHIENQADLPSIKMDCNETITDKDVEARSGEPILPEIEIDYDCIFGNIDKVQDIEKHLQLLFRPFICELDANCKFNLFEICIMMVDANFDPDVYPAIFLRIHSPCALAKIYASGKITSQAISVEGARMALMKVVQTVQELNCKTEITKFSQNIVHASFCMPFKIDLVKLTQICAKQVSANRRRRPFVTYMVLNSSIRFAVFSNGFVLLLHSSKQSESRRAIAAFLPILLQCQNGHLTASEKYGCLCGDISYKLLWERKLEEDKEGLLLYS